MAFGERLRRLGVDADRIVVAGESGGGNLTLATGMRLLHAGELGRVRGLFAMCPYIAGRWPQERFPSSFENNGLLLDLHNNRPAMAYGIEELERENPLAWPALRDGGRRSRFPPDRHQRERVRSAARRGDRVLSGLLLRAGVPARCRQVMGTIHATEIFQNGLSRRSVERPRPVSPDSATRPERVGRRR